MQNGVPIAAVNECVVRNHLFPVDLYPLLPREVGNVTIYGWDLGAYWPVPRNGSSFTLYEIVRIYYLPGNEEIGSQSVQSLPYVDVPYGFNCTSGTG